MRLFRKTREKFDRIIREEIDEPREMQALEVVTEAEETLRTSEAEAADEDSSRRGEQY